MLDSLHLRDDGTVREMTEAQWAHFHEKGWVSLGKLLSASDLAVLQSRIDEIMLGTAKGLDYAKMMMQLDSSTGRYEDIGAQTFGHKGSTLAYRKIQNLDLDPVFLSYVRRPVFEHICRRVYGAAAVASFRTMFFNKPANQVCVVCVRCRSCVLIGSREPGHTAAVAPRPVDPSG